MIASGDLNFGFQRIEDRREVFFEGGFSAQDLPDICASFSRGGNA